MSTPSAASPANGPAGRPWLRLIAVPAALWTQSIGAAALLSAGPLVPEPLAVQCGGEAGAGTLRQNDAPPRDAPFACGSVFIVDSGMASFGATPGEAPRQPEPATAEAADGSPVRLILAVLGLPLLLAIHRCIVARRLPWPRARDLGGR